LSDRIRINGDSQSGPINICTEKSLFGVHTWRFPSGRLLAQQICGSKLPHSKVRLLDQA
jgi:hypothetical protein